MAYQSYNYERQNAKSNYVARPSHRENVYKKSKIGEEISMFSQRFLQPKTLKRGFSQHQTDLQKTQPQTTNMMNKKNHQLFYDKVQKEDQNSRVNRSMDWIAIGGIKVNPAYHKINNVTAVRQPVNYTKLKCDENSIIRAFMKKGQKLQQKTSVNIIPSKKINQPSKKVGPAQNKLRKLFNKGDIQHKKTDQKEIHQSIDELIVEQYGNQSFDKLSESAIKEEIGVSSRAITRSINPIKQSMEESIGQSLIHISETNGIEEDIIDEQSGSKKNSMESYESKFQEQSIIEDISISHARLRKSSKVEELSASKSFRLKTSLSKPKIQEKSIELSNSRKHRKSSDQSIPQELAKQILVERQSLKKIKQSIVNLFARKGSDRNITVRKQDMLLQFKIEINKLVCSDRYKQKLKRITSFMKMQGKEHLPGEQLEDKIMANLMQQISKMKQQKINMKQIQQIRIEYENKLHEKLKKQEMELKIQMEIKLNQQNRQLKKIIAQLEQRMLGRSVQYQNYLPSVIPNRQQNVQIVSDQSIDSFEISWKQDLWQLLPEWEKKKLYEKQSEEVTHFITSIMMKELQQQALQRSMDISFEFPEEQIKDQSLLLREEPVRLKRQEIMKTITQISNTSNLSKQAQIKLKTKESRQQLNQQQIKIKKDNLLKKKVIEVLAKYKVTYLKKKNTVIRKVMKALRTKLTNPKESIMTNLQTITILENRQFTEKDLLYVRAYEQELINELVAVYNHYQKSSKNIIQEQMQKIYDRSLVVCQVKCAQKCSNYVQMRSVGYPIESSIYKFENKKFPVQIFDNDENYQNLQINNSCKQVKQEVVKVIVSLLSQQFAKELKIYKKL